MRTRTQYGPKWSFPEKSCGQGVDVGGNRIVGRLVALSLGVVPQEHRGVIAEALRHDMDRNATIEQQGTMRAAEMVEGEAGEAKPLGPPGKLFAEVPRVARCGE